MIRPWETFGTRDYTPEERARFAKLEDIMVPLDPAAAEATWAGIVTTAPARAPEPFRLEDFYAAVDRINEAAPYVRDRYVVPASRWDRILAAATPAQRADLESLVKNGTVVLSDQLPDDDHAYRLRLPAWETGPHDG